MNTSKPPGFGTVGSKKKGEESLELAEKRGTGMRGGLESGGVRSRRVFQLMEGQWRLKSSSRSEIKRENAAQREEGGFATSLKKRRGQYGMWNKHLEQLETGVWLRAGAQVSISR